VLSSIREIINSTNLLEGGSVQVQDDVVGHQNLLRLGLVKVSLNDANTLHMTLSCPLMRDLYLRACARDLVCPFSLEDCMADGQLSLLALVKRLLTSLPLDPLLNKASWVMDRITKGDLQGPSEKTYQSLFLYASFSCVPGILLSCIGS